MTRRLNVQELESRIVPSAGLAELLNQLGLTGYGNPDGILPAESSVGASPHYGFHVPSLEDTFTNDASPAKKATSVRTILGQ